MAWRRSGHNWCDVASVLGGVDDTVSAVEVADENMRAIQCASNFMILSNHACSSEVSCEHWHNLPYILGSIWTLQHMDLLAMLGFQSFHGPWGHLSTSFPCTTPNHRAGGIC
jgi:hypothetical protein